MRISDWSSDVCSSDLLVLAARDGEALEAVAERCRRAGAEVLTVPLDIADAEAVRQLAQSARDFCGSIDLWFSNVGVGAVGKFVDVPIEAHERTIRSNLIGHMNDEIGRASWRERVCQYV